MKYILAALFFVISITLAIAGGFKLSRLTERALAADQAVWIARYWRDANSLDEVCRLVNEERKTSILREEWNTGSGQEAVVGPIVGKERIIIRHDLAVHWRPAH